MCDEVVVVVVDDVGARLSGSASCSTAILRWQIEYWARSESGLPVMPMIGTLRSMRSGMKRRSSSVKPE